MTKKSLERIVRACELVESGEERFSCHAIEYGVPTKITTRYSKLEEDLAKHYAAFYDRTVYTAWGFDDKDDRLIAMLLFAEVEGGGVEQVL